MLDLSKHRLSFFFIIAFFVLFGTLFTIYTTRGYRIDLSEKTFKPTGLLVASSSPSGAQVYIDGKLKTATNNTISLAPGKYNIEIKKDGFVAWKKNLVIVKELVTQADAFLFPQIPDLKPLTFTEVQNPLISPDGTKIVYITPVLEADITSVAGLWVVDLTDFLFNIGREPRQIAKSSAIGIDFSKANYTWSPDSRQILVEISSPARKYLLDPNQLNSSPTFSDISANLPQIISKWQKETQVRENAKLKKLPEKMLEIFNTKADRIEFSPDQTKVFYVATSSAQIPEKLIPPVFAASTQVESRKIEAQKLYVYDIKEDKNFLVPFEVLKLTPTPTPKKTKITPTPTPQLLTFNFEFSIPRWFPTSRHLFWIKEDKVIACEFDGTNLTTIYSGPFVKPFVFTAPGANKLVILTQISFDKDTKPNLYAVSLR